MNRLAYLLAGGVLGGALSLALSGGRTSPASAQASVPRPPVASVEATPGAPAEGGRPQPVRVREEMAVPSAGATRVTDQLEALAATHPELAARLNLRLFDESLLPYENHWKLLGLGTGEAELLREGLREVFTDVRQRESERFEVLDRNEHQVRVGLPALPAEEAATMVARVDRAFAEVLPPELGKVMSRQFIDQHLSVTGGIDGRDRIVTITLTSQQLFESVGRRYEIRTHVLLPGNSISVAAGDPNRFAQSNGSVLVEHVPDYFAHLFEEAE